MIISCRRRDPPTGQIMSGRARCALTGLDAPGRAELFAGKPRAARKPGTVRNQVSEGGSDLLHQFAEGSSRILSPFLSASVGFGRQGR